MNEFMAVAQQMREEMKKMEEVERRTFEFFQDEIKTATEDAYKEFGNYQEKEIRKIFDKAVTDFYDSYPNPKYRRKGNTSSKSGGLYDVLKIQKDEDGMVILDEPGYDNIYDSSRLVGRKGRDGQYGGQDLFQTVFVEGWHGGAKGIASDKEDKWGAHPSPGIPYYRTRGPVRLSNGSVVIHKWGSWGKRAAKANISPYEAIKTNLAVADDGYMNEEWSEIANRHLNEAFQRVDQKREELLDEILG